MNSSTISTTSTVQLDYVEEAILTGAMHVQLQKWKCKLDSGHKRVGWKIGFNALADQERMKLRSPIVGYLTSESVLESESIYTGTHTSKLMVEAEVAILIGEDVTTHVSKEQATAVIKGFAPAIEIVDFARVPHDMTSILEDNIFHEAVIIGDLNKNLSELKVTDIFANVLINGETIQSGDPSRYPKDMGEIISCVSDILSKQGEYLQAGDWIIAGSITIPVEVKMGDQVNVSLAPLGSLMVTILKE